MTYRVLSVVVLVYALWGIGRLALEIRRPMGGFIWYCDEAVSGGWIVNWDTGTDWPAIGKDKLQRGDQILTVEGHPADAFGEVYRTTSLGTGITYEVLRDGHTLTIPDIPVVAFTWSMFFQSQVILFIIGFLYWLMGVFIHYVTPESEYGYAFSFFTLSTSLITLSHASTVSVSTPFRPQILMFFFWKPIFGTAIISSLHFATTFPLGTPDLPPPISKRFIRRAGWGLGSLLLVLYVITGLLPSHLQHWDARLYTLNLIGFGLSLLGCTAIFAHIARTTSSFIARQRAIVMLVGWGLATFPILLMWVKLVFPHFYMLSWNVIAFLELALPLSIVYAILHYRLFDVRPYVLRFLHYSLLLVGFLFVYIITALILQSMPWFDQLQAAFVRVTRQPFDLRATLSTLLAALAVVWLYLPLQQQWLTPNTGLRSRFPAILAHLCDRLDAQSGYIALRHENVFIVEATHNIPLPRQALDLSTVLGEEAEIEFKVPLEVQNEEEMLGVIALGPKKGEEAYTAADTSFVTGPVAELITASLLSLQQLMQFEDEIQVSQAQVVEAQDNVQVLQSELTRTLTMRSEELIEAVEQALYALSYEWPADLKALTESPLVDLPAVHVKLAGSANPESSEWCKGKALKTTLLDIIDTLKPPPPEDLNDDAWLHYLILKGAFVENRHWKQLHIELSLSQASYYRKRRAAIAAMAHNINRHSTDTL
jgi:hypothetical protein